MGREETQEIRDWARALGYSPSDRGRISQDIKQACLRRRPGVKRRPATRLIPDLAPNPGLAYVLLSALTTRPRPR
jgi:hypothetical protein